MTTAPRRAGDRRALLALLLLATLPFPVLGQSIETSRPTTTPPPLPPPVGEPTTPPIAPVLIPPGHLSRRVAPAAVVIDRAGANVTIDGPIATTQLEFALRNPDRVAREASLLIPVPEGAVIRSFQYDGTGPEPTATLLPRDEARKIYNDIVRRSLDPGVLEFAGHAAIRSSVFPIPAGATQSVRITFEQVLKPDGQRLDYVLPRSESGDDFAFPWTITASIKADRPIASVYSPGHALNTDRQGDGSLRVRLAEADQRRGGSFRLSILPAARAASELPATVFAYPDPSVGPKGGYAMILLLPDAARAAGQTAKPIRREVTIVLDRSGSMRGPKMAQAKAAAKQIITGLEDGELFNIIDFSDTVASFSAKPVAKTAGRAAEASAYVDQLVANGGTAIADALLEALRPDPAEGYLPLVLFMTDGLPTVGEAREAPLRELIKSANTHQRRVFTIGVGADVNTPLLSAIAAGSRGAPTYVLPGEDLEIAMSQVFRRLSGPVLAAPRLSVVPASGQTSPRLREIMPPRLGDLFEGDQLVIACQYLGDEPVTIRLEGEQGGKLRTWEQTLSLAEASPRHGFVPRLWARQRIAFLIDQIRQAGADPHTAGPSDPRFKELIDEIVSLSQKFGILTEYTAFLATEQPRPTNAVPIAPADASAEWSRRAASVTADRVNARSGAGAVNQEKNVQALAKSPAPAAAAPQTYLDKNLKPVQITSVRSMNQSAIYQRGARWVEGRLLAHADLPPQQTLAFGSPEYDRAVDRLVATGRGWMLATAGELLVDIDGQRTLLQAPAN
jgi:Ca-activated chloride channel family protein